MSPERKAIIDAINMGNRTTSLIALAIHKPPQTVAKMVSKLKKLGIVLVDNSGCFYIPVDNNVDSNVDISTQLSTPVDNSILVRLNFIENNIAILTQKNADSKQQFKQLKKDLLAEIKKNDFDVNNPSVELVQEKQELIDNIEWLKDDYQQLENEHKSALNKLDYSDNLLLKKQQEIEHLQADIKRLKEAK